MTAATIERDRTRLSEATGILSAIRARRSIGRVRPECPPRDVIEHLLEAATWAPNHRLTEPWRFIVLAGEAREALGDVMARSLAATLPPDAPGRQAQLDKARGKPLRAPVVIATAVEPRRGPKVVEIEEVLADGAAVQNLLLAAHALGLGAIWRTGEPSYDPAVKAFLGLPADAHLLGFVYVGYPDGPAPRMHRTPPGDRTRWLGWPGTAAG
ncbi:MAG: nitroreductase [Chloroflexota bacterium]|nr:nitroreductase [Chloroflexota bacterium]